MPICPMMTAACKAAVTGQRPIPLKVQLPKPDPRPSARKIAISGY
jgi:hypothetical protein